MARTTSDLPRTGNTERLRKILKAAREDRGLTQQEVAELISKALPGEEVRSGEAVGGWERLRRDPKVNVMAKWARVLGYKLFVDLHPEDEDRVAVLVDPEIADAVRALQAATKRDREVVLGLIRRLALD